MNTHFFVYNGECYLLHYAKGHGHTDLITGSITTVEGREMIPTTEMLDYALTDIINTLPLRQDA